MRYYLTPVHLRYEVRRRLDRLANKAVWKLPRGLAYRCAIRVISNATVGPYSNQIVPELTAMDALKRWDEPVAA
jgi:hypothetical protein